MIHFNAVLNIWQIKDESIYDSAWMSLRMCTSHSWLLVLFFSLWVWWYTGWIFRLPKVLNRKLLEISILSFRSEAGLRRHKNAWLTSKTGWSWASDVSAELVFVSVWMSVNIPQLWDHRWIIAKKKRREKYGAVPVEQRSRRAGYS